MEQVKNVKIFVFYLDSGCNRKTVKNHDPNLLDDTEQTSIYEQTGETIFPLLSIMPKTNEF